MIKNSPDSSSGLVATYPQVTIGICVKNCQKTIAECLESLLNSNYGKTKMEIITVDGKSIDNTLNIVRRILSNSGVRFKILSDHGKGLGYARQLVIENASSKYICWVDGDNCVTSSFIRNHIEFIRTKPSVGMAIPLTLTKSRKPVARLEMYNWLISTLNAFMKGKTPPAMMQGTITSVAVLKEVGGFNINFSGSGEDVDLIRRIKLKGYLTVVNPRVIIYHTMRESWRGILKQMRWYGRTQPRRASMTVLIEALVSFFLRTKSLLTFARYFRDPICFFLPVFSLFQHVSYLVYYFSCS